MNAEHLQLRETLLRRLADRDTGAVWTELHDAGVLGLFVPEAGGGLNLPPAALEPVFDVLGFLGQSAACLETTVIAASLLRRLPSSQALELQRRIAGGDRIAVAGLEPQQVCQFSVLGDQAAARLSGFARIVIGGMDADALLVVVKDRGEPTLFLAGEGWREERRSVPTIDGRMAADIILTNVAAVRLGSLGDDGLEAVQDEATTAICVEASGLMRRLVRDTVAYAKQREQFGQPISGFQVVQHRLVDMNIQARRAASISSRAVAALDAPRTARALAVSAAKVTICRTGRKVGQDAVQLHGGMGMTEELPIGRLFKRLTVIEAQFGNADSHLRRFDALRTAA